MTVGRRSFSEGAKQGPITTSGSGRTKAVEQRLSTQATRRMGPCVRRDDSLTRRRQDRLYRPPWPPRGGEPDQPPLNVVAAPVAQHHRRLVVLDPFRHSLDMYPPRQVDQRLHEGAIVRRARDVLHEGAIDFDNVDAELAQIAEGGVAGAEIVDRDPAAEILQPRDEAPHVVC